MTSTDYERAKQRIHWTMAVGGMVVVAAAVTLAFAIGFLPTITQAPSISVRLVDCPRVSFGSHPTSWINLKASIQIREEPHIFFEFRPPVGARFTGCEEIAVASSFAMDGMHIGIVPEEEPFDTDFISHDLEWIARQDDGWVRVPEQLFSKFDGTFQFGSPGAVYPLSFRDRIVRLNLKASSTLHGREHRISTDTRVHILEPSSIVDVAPQVSIFRVIERREDERERIFEDVIFESTLPEQHLRFDPGIENEDPTQFEIVYRTYSQRNLEDAVLIGSGALLGAGVSALLEAFLAGGLLLRRREYDPDTSEVPVGSRSEDDGHEETAKSEAPSDD